MFPEEVAAACLGHIAQRGLDSAGLTMAFWITLKGETIKVLFDPDALPMEVAAKAAGALKKADAHFPLKFLNAVEDISAPPILLRALGLVPALGDYSVLLSWLRTLSRHSDQRVKSRAVKLLCELRPNKGQIERQMLSDDARIRASAIEALWYSRTPEATELFKAAAKDPHHRVVGNALAGLYLLGDRSLVPRMIELCKSPDPFFRAAMAWCFGFVGEKLAIPTLHELAKDTSPMVRKRALLTLLALQGSEEPIAPETVIAAPVAEQEPIQPKQEEAPAVKPETAPVIEKAPERLTVPRFASLS